MIRFSEKNLNTHIFLVGILLLAGCTDREKSPNKLILTLKNRSGGFQVIDYQTNENPYHDSNSQGGYRVHLLDEDDKILVKIGFQLMDTASSQNHEGKGTFKLPIPLIKNLHSVQIYKLDLSSGHYQLKGDDPLLSWSLPDTLAE